MMQKAALAWVLGWALFGLPWTSFEPHPHLRPIHLFPFEQGRTLDSVLNFGYYLPLGIIGIGLGSRAGLVVISAIILSSTTELAQVFSTTRVPSIADITLNSAGAITGVALTLRSSRRAHRRSTSASNQD